MYYVYMKKKQGKAFPCWKIYLYILCNIIIFTGCFRKILYKSLFTQKLDCPKIFYDNIKSSRIV